MSFPTDLHIRPVSSDHDWREAQRIREVVFIQEQHCPPEEEWDEWDETARHILFIHESRVMGTARWRAYAVNDLPAAKLERLALLPEARGRGWGKILLQALLDDAGRAGFTRFVLHAQYHLTGFYAAFGFEPIEGVFDEAGIPHQRMVRGFSR